MLSLNERLPMTRGMTAGAIRGRGLVLLLVAAVAGCGTLAAPTTWTPGNRQPLIVGWQQYFRVQWDASTKGKDTIVEGYITNIWGFTAQQIQLLVTGYDATGKQLGQLVAWGPNEIDPGSRVYFDVPVPPGASTYDVAMFAWNWVQTGGSANFP
jgi:hypothetical protein